MRTARLPVDPGPSGWAAILPDTAPVPLSGDRDADWLIVGAGFAGLAAARRLSLTRPGEKIVVLDAVRLGEGPAGRNSGFMIDLPHHLASEGYGGRLDADSAEIADNRLAIAFARDMARDFGMPKEAFAEAGKINAAATRKGEALNARYAAHLDALDEAHETLDADRMRALTGSDYNRSGLYTPGTAIIQPAMFIRRAAEGLRNRGVEIYEVSPVLELERSRGWVARTPSGRVTASRVVLAVNGHAESFGIAVGRLLHIFTYASMTRALTEREVTILGGAPEWGATPADPMGTTVRRVSGTGGARILVRNRFTCEPSMEVGPARIAEVARYHDRAFRARFPALSGVEMEFRWGGRLCLSRNDVQLVGKVEDGLFTACVQNGLGTVRGTLAGMLAADLATGKRSAALDRMTAADPPARLPPAGLTRLGASMRIRWGELRAGREL